VAFRNSLGCSIDVVRLGYLVASSFNRTQDPMGSIDSDFYGETLVGLLLAVLAKSLSCDASLLLGSSACNGSMILAEVLINNAG